MDQPATRMAALLCSAALFTLPAAVPAAAPAVADDESDEPSIPFSEAQVLIQLNDTDGDLGFHARIDGDPWKKVKIEAPDGSKLFKVKLAGKLRRQGLTELAFESAEPTFDELSPRVFFKRFPEGTYEIEGVSGNGVEMESSSTLSHIIPSAPANLHVSSTPASDDCDADVPEVLEPVVISWDPVETSHPELGREGDIEVDSYELAIEAESIDITLNVEGDVTQVILPLGIIRAGEFVKYQVLVREAAGNETSSESCFTVM